MIRRIFLLTIPALVAFAQAAPPADEKLLAGFEEDEIKRMIEAVKVERKDGKDKEGRAVVTISRAYYMNPWTLLKGNASQGEYAMALAGVREPEKVGFGAKVQVPAAAALYYGLTIGDGAVFNTCGLLKRFYPPDWSDYDLLRADVLCGEPNRGVRVALEDEEIAPPVVRTHAVEPGKWTTLEVDLRAAAEARGLNLKRMTTLTIGILRGEGGSKGSLLDNIRLARKGTSCALPVVRDDSSHQLPEYFRASTKLEPEKIPGGPWDHAPLTAEKPIVIPTEKTSVVNPVGWIAARDNQRLLVGFLEKNSVEPTNVLMLQTKDGGKNWRGLDGATTPTPFRIVGSDHGGGRGDVVGSRPDVIVLTNLGCRGGSWASLRLFAQKVTFSGDGWELRELPTLVDCDLRHCNSNQSIVRTADGRLWAGYGFAGRTTATSINVRTSDDDGVTWKSWAEGKSGAVPGLEKPPVDGWTYNFEEPCLVPLGRGIACLWEEFGGANNGRIRWSRFEDGKWSAIETIDQPKRESKNPTSRPAVSAVSVRGEEIFMVGARFSGVLHYRSGKWTVEAPEVPRGGRLSVAGDRHVMAVAATPDGGDVYKGAVTLQAWRRSADGAWSGPEELAKEEQPLSNKGSGNIYNYRPGFVVQPYAPPNFVPVAWTCEGQKWIKVLRLPVE